VVGTGGFEPPTSRVSNISAYFTAVQNITVYSQLSSTYSLSSFKVSPAVLAPRPTPANGCGAWRRVSPVSVFPDGPSRSCGPWPPHAKRCGRKFTHALCRALCLDTDGMPQTKAERRTRCIWLRLPHTEFRVPAGKAGYCRPCILDTVPHS